MGKFTRMRRSRASSSCFLIGTGPSLSHLLWTVPTSLPQSQPSLVLLTMQNKTEGKFFLQRLRTLSVGSDSPPPGLFYVWSSPVRHLWHYFHFWPRVQTRLLDLHGVPPRHHLSKGVGQHQFPSGCRTDICNNQKPTKILPKRNCKENINAPSIHNVGQQLDYIFKTKIAPTTIMTNNFLSLPGQEVHSIFQYWKPLQNRQVNSMCVCVLPGSFWGMGAHYFKVEIEETF